MKEYKSTSIKNDLIYWLMTNLSFSNKIFYQTTNVNLKTRYTMFKNWSKFSLSVWLWTEIMIDRINFILVNIQVCWLTRGIFPPRVSSKFRYLGILQKICLLWIKDFFFKFWSLPHIKKLLKLLYFIGKVSFSLGQGKSIFYW